MQPRTLASVISPSTPPRGTSSDAPRISLWLNHLCCSGCLSDLRSALVGFPWVAAVTLAEDGLPDRSAADAGAARPKAFNNRVDITLRRIDTVDFVTLESAVRRAGFAVERMEISGLHHYAVEADLPHFCCNLCSIAASEGTEMLKTLRATGRFTWLDSVVVNKTKKRLTAYVRYDRNADITELGDALDHLGFAPASLRLSVEVPGRRSAIPGALR